MGYHKPPHPAGGAQGTRFSCLRYARGRMVEGAEKKGITLLTTVFQKRAGLNHMQSLISDLV